MPKPKPEFASFLARDKEHKWLARRGDTLTVMDPVERTIACRPVVTDFEPLEYGVRIRVDQKIPNLRIGTDYEASCSFLNDDCCLAGFVVRNNIFKSAVRFGFLLKSHDGLVEGNHYVCYVNGVKVLDFTNPRPMADDGYIALQLHSGGLGNMMFKDIYVKDLSHR